MLIDDGAGKGFKAQVTPELALKIQGVTEPESRDAAEEGDCFFFRSLNLFITVTGTQAGIMNINYTGNKRFTIERVHVSSNTGVEWQLHRNGTNLATGTATFTALNCAFGSQKTFEGATLIGGDNVIMTGATAGNTIAMLYANGETIFHIADDIIMDQNNSIGITVSCSSTAIVGINLIGFEHD